MARYSFYVHDKETGMNLYSRKKYPLPFLDYFSSQFANSSELIKFLGINPEKYDDVGVVYKSEGTIKNLCLYFDSLELEKISGSLVRLPFAYSTMPIREKLAIGYAYPRMIGVENKLSDSDEAREITRRIHIIPGFADRAYKLKYLDNHTYGYYKRQDYEHLHSHLLKSYLSLRKIYALLRSEYYLIGTDTVKPPVDLTMQEIIGQHVDANDKTLEILRAYEILKKLKLTRNEEGLVVRILANDEEAYNELLASDAERLEYLKPLLTYFASMRGKVKKIGSIIDN